MSTSASTLVPIQLSMFLEEYKQFLVTVTISGSPTSLSGCVLVWTLKTISGVTVQGPGLIQKRSDDGGITITDVANGLATITILPADTTSLSANPYYLWDLRLINESVSPPQPFTIATGRMQLLQNVTDAVT